MFHPLIDNSAKTIQYVFIWLAYALLQTIGFYTIIALPIWILMLDGLVHAVLFGIIGLVLWSVGQKLKPITQTELKEVENI